MARYKPIPSATCWSAVRSRGIIHTSVANKILGISRASTYRIWKRFRSSGDPVRAGSTGGTRPPKLTRQDLKFIIGMIQQQPDIYLDEIRNALQERRAIKVHISTIWRSLARIGYSMKKVEKHARERDPDKRDAFSIRIGRYRPEQLVFVDESSFDRRTTYRNYGWAPRGERAVRFAFFIRGRRYSVLPALSLQGMVFCKIVEGSFNSEVFTKFITNLLDEMQPFPGPNSVIVMDNCRIHKKQHIRDLIERRGMRLEFLPPYSPDFNPIELAFSVIKSRVRRDGGLMRQAMGEKDDTGVYDRLRDIVFSITPDDAQGFYHECLYV